MSDRSGRNWAWQHFWEADRTASCVPGKRATEEQINAHWRAFFDALPGGSRILDIGTGNGAVLRQAIAAAPGHGFELVGVDLAAIDPLRYAPDGLAEHADVRFLGGVDAAELPFEAASFDIIVSQYGLEYAKLDPALDEVERVLRPDGRLFWLAHSEESEVVRQNAEQHRQVDLLLARNGPLDAMQQLVERIRRRKSPGLPMARLNKAMQGAEEFCRRHPHAAIVTEVCRGLADTANRWQAYDPADLHAMVEHTRRELVAHRQRILDLRDAVISAGREEWLRQRLGGPPWQRASVAPLTAGAGSEPIGILVDSALCEHQAGANGNG